MMKQILLAAAVLAAVPTPALAQDTLRVRVGAGAQVRPDFIGADRTEIAPLWDVDLASGTNPFKFEAPDYAFGIPIISKGGFSFGPAANLENGRRDSDIGAPLGRVKRTFEAGAFASYDLGSFHLRGDVLKGIGGHEGLIGTLGVDKVWRDGDKYVFSVGPRLLFSDGRYQRAYFGVTPAASLATGLPVYQPEGGIHGIAAAAGMSLQLNSRWGLFGFGRYERLIGDAGRSPVVRVLGSRNQLSAGVGLNYTFTINR